MYMEPMKRRRPAAPPSPASAPPPLAPSEPLVLRDALALPEVPGRPEPPMVRTQIYLTRAEHRFLQSEATRCGRPMAAILRDYIDERMGVPEASWEDNPLLAPPADPGFVGPKDGAVNHDHYVYGGPKRWVKRGGRWVEAPPLPEDYYTDAAVAAAYDRALEEVK